MHEPSVNIEELTVNWTKAQPVVAAFISSIIPNIHQTDDILQEVALAIVRKYDQYDHTRPFTAWAVGIAKNELLRHRRNLSRDRHIFNNEILSRVADIYVDKANDLAETKNALNQCVSQLQPKWRKILELRYSLGLEVKGVAKQLGISANATFITLHRIRQALRACVERRLGGDEIEAHG